MNNTSKSITKKESFAPTPGMQVWLSTAIELVSDDISEVSEACNISRTSWYRWIKDPEFRKWFKAEWDNRLTVLSWKLDVQGLKNSSKDFKFWKAMQQRTGNLRDGPAFKQNIGIMGSQVEFVMDDD